MQKVNGAQQASAEPVTPASSCQADHGSTATTCVAQETPRITAIRPTLTDLSSLALDRPRLLHGLGTRSFPRFALRVASVGFEVAVAALADRLLPLRGRITEVSAGRAPPSGGSIALYAHWSPAGRISPMVRRQIAQWRAVGFDVVFVTNASPPPRDWDAIAENAVLRVRRTNAGGDFGAWRDAAAVTLPRLRTPTELLLVNDSMLGPFGPLEPLVDAWREGSSGFFGMTESHAGGTHLQSYAVLARGDLAIAEVLGHLGRLRDSRSKWRIVRDGEIGLTQRLAASRVRCAALYAYARVLQHARYGPREALGARFATTDAFGQYPLNPCHHFWRILLEQMGFPFIKTCLVSSNPWRLPDVSSWESLVTAKDAALAREHLSIMCGAEA